MQRIAEQGSDTSNGVAQGGSHWQRRSFWLREREPGQAMNWNGGPASIALLVCSLGYAQQGDKREPSPPQPSPTPLRTLTSAKVASGAEIFAWVNPIECDQDANLFFLLAPHATKSQVEKARESGSDLPL